MQAQVQDRTDLNVAQPIAVAFDVVFDRLDQPQIGRDLADRPLFGEQRLARFGRACRTPDDLDDFVQIGDRDDQAKQDMGAVARLVQLELGAAGDDLFAELDEGLDDLAQA